MFVGQKRGYTEPMDDANSSQRSLFSKLDAPFKRKRSLVAVPRVLSSPEAIQVPFASRIASALSGKLLSGCLLNPSSQGTSSLRNSLNSSRLESPVRDSMRDSLPGPLRYSLRDSLRKSLTNSIDDFCTSKNFQKNGFAIVGSHSVGIAAHRPAVSSPDVMRLKMALLQNYKASLAVREKLLTDDFDAETKRLMDGRKKLTEQSEHSLSSEQRQLVQQCFAAASQRPQDVVVEAHRIELTYADLATLRSGKWLNDNVIDMYLTTIAEEHPNISIFTTHFFSRLEADGYSAVKRWALRKGLDVFVPDKVFVPVNRGNLHWTLAVIDNKNKELVFYDSLPSGRGRNELQLLLTYLKGEAERMGRNVVPDYALIPQGKCPSQENGSDCGVFVCEAITRLAAGKPLSHSQKSMPIIREKMALKLINLRLNSKL